MAPTTRKFGIGFVGIALVLAVVFFAGERAERGPAEAPRGAAPAVSAAPSPDPLPRASVASPSAPRPPGEGPSMEGEPPALDPGDEIAWRWAAVDLDAVRAALPDNLYWQTGAPTSDPEVERERAEERARWNEEYGKVLSGNANEDEIRAYYAHRRRMSSDYIAFASHLLDGYRDVLPERDVGLLELSVKMHHTRLQELPRRQAEAFERKLRQDALRAAWLADEAAFASDPE